MARIPTRLSGGSAGIQEFMNRLYPQMPSGPAMSTLTARPAAGGQPVTRGTPPMALAQQAQLPAYGLRAAAMRGPQTAMGATPPKKPMSLMERLSPEFGTPASAGLGAAAATGLQLSGYSPTPISTAQGLGAMMQSGMQAFQAAKAAETAEKRAALQDRIAMAKLGKKSNFEEKLALAGIDVSTPEGQAEARKILMKSDTVFMGGDKQKEEAYKAALETRKNMIKQVENDRELGVRLDTAIDLLQSGVSTGRLQSAMLPLKQLAREANILGDDEIKELSNQEIIDSVASFLTPRMRVVGSGASSDRDMDFFQRATVRMANTPQANLVIAKMQKQVMDYNKKRLNLFEKYVKREGDDFGFAEFADKELGNFYERARSDEEFTQLIDDGKLKEGDVFFNAMVGEFDVLTKEMM